jgi:uncharacterized protein YhbP (UPF0306 family)
MVIINSMDNRIEKFISNHQTLTLATVENGQPYCCSLFYAFDSEECRFYFMSSADTRHIVEAIKNPKIAGTIVKEINSIAHLQGLQFIGRIIAEENSSNKKAEKNYLSKFPFAKIFASNLWVIDIDYIKMTDNTLGFGKKIIWEKETNDAAI